METYRRPIEASEQLQKSTYVQNRVDSTHLQLGSRKQKTAALLNLKKQLAKYDNLEEISDDELDHLCESVQYQGQLDKGIKASQNLNGIQSFSTSSSEFQERYFEEEPCDTRLYIIKFKEILLVVLFVLCIIARSFIDDTNSYTVGQYIVYNTRYNKSMFQTDLSKEEIQEGWFQRLTNFGKQTQIQLYLPKMHQKSLKKTPKDFTYGECIRAYSHFCINSRLVVYGSINLEQEEWILDHISGDEKIMFEMNPDFTLSIVLAAKMIKKYEEEIKITSNNKLVLIETAAFTALQMDSIKLSLIQNDCQDKVSILKITSKQSLTHFYQSFDMIFVTQQYFTINVLPYADPFALTFKSTTFLIYLSQGINSQLNNLIQTLNDQLVSLLQFSVQSNLKHYRIKKYEQKNSVENQYVQKSLTCLIINGFEGKTSKQEVDLFVKSQSQQPSLVKLKESQKSESLMIMSLHECIKPFTYEPLAISSRIEQFVYISALLEFKLFVELNKIGQYGEKGAISPQLIFFITSNINIDSNVLFHAEVYHDDLVLLTLAKQINAKHHLRAIYPNNPNRAIFLESLKINNMHNLIIYEQISINDEQSVKKLYSTYNFNFIFTSIRYFIRDYFKIYHKDTRKVVIFYWVMDKSQLEFMSDMISRHRVSTIIEKEQKYVVEDRCLDYEMKQVAESELPFVSQQWLIVEL